MKSSLHLSRLQPLCRRTWIFVCFLVLLLAAAAGAPLQAAAPGALKVRTITAFVPFDPADAQSTLEEAASFLEQARRRFEAAGFEVQTLRLSTPPLASYLNRTLVAERMDYFLRLDRWAAEKGLVVSLGPAVVEDVYDARQVEFVVELLRRSRVLHTSLIIADENGPHPNAVRAAAVLIRELGRTPAAEPLGFRFAALAHCPPGIPFFPASYAEGKQREFAIGLESAGVFAAALRGETDSATKRVRLRAALTAPLQRLESIAVALAGDTGWSYGGLDTSPAPNGEVSIAAAVEALSGRPFGDPGTLAAVAELTSLTKTLPVKRAGFSGLMLPVLEDRLLAERATEGRVSLQLLLAYSAVSGTGLDVVPLPGAATSEQLERVLGDVAALAVKLRKPLTARLLVVAGKRAGEMTDFDSPWLTNTRVLPFE